jgi:hypothetical protein
MRESRASAALVLILWLLLLHPTSRAQEVVEQGKLLRPVEDSDITSEFPDWNRGLFRNLAVSTTLSEFAFLMFDLSEVPSDARITEATLQLFTASVATSSYPTPIVGVHYCPSNDWTEDGITYNNKPAFSTEPVDSVNVTQAQRLYEWNVTDIVSTTLQGGNKKLTLVLKAETRRAAGFYSAEQPADPLNDIHPRLRVSYLAPRQSDTNPALNILIAIIIAGAATIALTITYTRLKKRKHAGQNLSKPKTQFK